MFACPPLVAQVRVVRSAILSRTRSFCIPADRPDITNRLSHGDLTARGSERRLEPEPPPTYPLSLFLGCVELILVPRCVIQSFCYASPAMASRWMTDIDEINSYGKQGSSAT